ncbi:hypothetical protein [Solemya velum gill symbiont]|uniref:Folate-dependent phosphoribosylglycinamide formyltransferase PurN n=2 Tax=Solemya velum gill symbiont TaxID=2340 RepID=A0A0B0H6Q6_SOVGS|nr:hypothetical protein [Solemya velum gill symbiont]KHF24790.1 folate-dependent phosphoribosylglycinamide formyltransferase PurN [Solemya velum gill symbiont]OOY33941.1 hypothetical protein BOV88_12670 [Solemya velum gill symbiont]OOY43375.1 hypothetical protein BOV91_04210 [Solemya velum gill symbiont]OOY45904.1 hypothetical protein BOV93_11965 [Solemya velum gill symbiont]OOY49338.1 hypothetical protein BOV94_11390 [Solemya velum gill symbiont]
MNMQISEQRFANQLEMQGSPVCTVQDSASQLSIVYLTSLRELHKEGVGRVVCDLETGCFHPRRTGSLEELVYQLNSPESPLHGRYKLTGVIVDDDDTRLLGGDQPLWNSQMPVSQGISGQGVEESVTLDQITCCIPSSRWAGTCPENRAEKRVRKSHYEAQIAQQLDKLGADIVISDSYVRIIGDELLGYGSTGSEASECMFINIHPAVTDTGRPDRLPGATPTRDALTRAHHGYVIVDDKHHVDLPEGEEIQVVYKGRNRTARRVAPVLHTAASVHYVSPRVDNGEVIHCVSASLPQKEFLTEESLRHLNYQLKREALKEALIKLADDSSFLDLVGHKRRSRHQSTGNSLLAQG